MNIAYIEDDADARSIFVRKLTHGGIACETFTSAEEALPKIGPGSFDVLLVDIRLPGISGIQLLRKLRQSHVFTPCILITAFNSLQHMREALNASASYLLEKPFPYDSLRKLLDRIMESPGSLQHCVDRGLARLSLTDREQEIARYILKGLSNAEIARVATISEKTVKQYVTQLFEKADVKSRAEFFSYIFPI